MIQHKTAAFKLKAEPSVDGAFEGYASVFNIKDQGDDIVVPGAFTRSLAARKVQMLWQHDTTQPIGVWDEVREDAKGLFVKGHVLSDIRQGKEALVMMKNGIIDSMSIGFSTIKSEPDAADTRVRRLLDIELFEISLVTFPMLPQAQITAVKTINTIRQFEEALRDAGFSQTEAKAIAADGFKGFASHRDGVEVVADQAGLMAIHQQLAQLKEKFHV